MIPTKFEESNFVFTKPASMTDEQCSSLPVFRGKDQEGFPVIVSCWKVSDDDLLQIIENRSVWLTITGEGMPPVSLFTENPFKNVETG